MSPDQALLASALLLMLAWGLSVLLPAAWRAHLRGLARVRAAEVRYLLAWQERDQEALEVLAAPPILYGRARGAVPMRDLPPGETGAHGGDGCAHGKSWADACPDCRVRV